MFSFSLVNEWNTSKICHRCREPLQEVMIKKKKKREDDDDDDKERWVISRGLRRCQSDALQTRENSGLSHYSSSRVICPIGGKLINRDSNAAANIAIKLITLMTKDRCINNETNNYIMGVKVGKLSKIKLSDVQLRIRNNNNNKKVLPH